MNACLIFRFAPHTLLNHLRNYTQLFEKLFSKIVSLPTTSIIKKNKNLIFVLETLIEGKNYIHVFILETSGSRVRANYCLATLNLTLMYNFGSREFKLLTS